MFKGYGLIYNENTKSKSEQILCAYQNRTKHLQVVKIENVANFCWEKVVFPSETILFEAIKQAQLKIFSNDSSRALLTDTISCNRLQVLNT